MGSGIDTKDEESHLQHCFSPAIALVPALLAPVGAHVEECTIGLVGQ